MRALCEADGAGAMTGNTPQDRAVWALAELQCEQPDPAALEVLRKAAATWWRDHGAVLFDRVLGLPTAGQFRRRARDYAIAEAMRLTPGANPHERAVQLRQLLNHMATRGRWRRWREQGGAPAADDVLQHRAFEVLCNGSDPTVPAVPSLTLLRAGAPQNFQANSALDVSDDDVFAT